MGEKPNVPEQVLETHRIKTEESRESLTERLEGLEHGIMDTWQGATASLNETVENVQESLKTTMHSVQGAVHDTTQAMRRALDLPAHLRRHPWMFVCGAAFLGVMAGFLLGRSRK